MLVNLALLTLAALATAAPARRGMETDATSSEGSAMTHALRPMPTSTPVEPNNGTGDGHGMGGHGGGDSAWDMSGLTKCRAHIDFSTAFSTGNGTLPLPTGKLVAATVSRGVQNYTCTDGVYISVGALANLFDMSCLLQEAGRIEILDPATVAGALTPGALMAPFANDSPAAQIHHEFVAFNHSIAPFFVAHGKGVTLAKKESLPSPVGSIPWLFLTAVDDMHGHADLATEVYRVSTEGGVPPTSCTGTGDLSVDYAALYYFFK